MSAWPPWWVVVGHVAAALVIGTLIYRGFSRAVDWLMKK